MEKVQENKMSMYLAVHKVVNSYVEAWKDLLAFQNLINEYDGVLNNIKAFRLVQEKKITGLTKNKRDARSNAVKKCLAVAGAFYSYAVFIGDNDLADRVSYSMYDFNRCRDTIVRDRLELVHNTVQEYIEDMPDYGVTQEDLDELEALTEKYAETCEDPRHAITDRSRATKQLKDLFKNADSILKMRLDKMIVQFKENRPDFWQHFKNARKIVNLGHRKRKKATAESVKA